jgi:hypothetical protein
MSSEHDCGVCPECHERIEDLEVEVNELLHVSRQLEWKALKRCEEYARQQAEWWDDWLARGLATAMYHGTASKGETSLKLVPPFDPYYALKKIREELSAFPGATPQDPPTDTHGP